MNNTSSPVTLTEAEVVKKTIKWLDGQRNDMGLYPHSCVCTTKECIACVKNDISWREGPFMIWGRYKYYQKTGNISDLTKINQELEILSKKPMQFEDWNCRILLDLWNNNKLSKETKQKVVNLCANDGRVSVNIDFIKNLDQIDSDINIDDINENISKIMSNQLIVIDKNLYNSDILKTNFSKNSFFTSENIAKKIILSKNDKTNEVKLSDSNNIKSPFKFALYGYSLLNSTPSVYNNAVLGIAALDMYHYYNDKVYLDLAQHLYSQSKTLEVKSDYFGLMYQSFFLTELNKENKQKENDDQIGKNMTVLINNFYNKNLNAFMNRDLLNVKENWLIIGLLER
ncbi:MAG: hypothetical protein WCG91_02320 [Candidatus Shapirobacteria bacterium]